MKTPDPLVSVRELFSDSQIDSAMIAADISSLQWRAMTNAEQVALCRKHNPPEPFDSFSGGGAPQDGQTRAAGEAAHTFALPLHVSTSGRGGTSIHDSHDRYVAAAMSDHDADDKANAAFIIRACNNHSALLDMLTEARGQLVELNQSENDDGEFLARLDALIAKATT